MDLFDMVNEAHLGEAWGSAEARAARRERRRRATKSRVTYRGRGQTGAEAKPYEGEGYSEDFWRENPAKGAQGRDRFRGSSGEHTKKRTAMALAARKTVRHGQGRDVTPEDIEHSQGGELRNRIELRHPHGGTGKTTPIPRDARMSTDRFAKRPGPRDRAWKAAGSARSGPDPTQGTMAQRAQRTRTSSGATGMTAQQGMAGKTRPGKKHHLDLTTSKRAALSSMRTATDYKELFGPSVKNIIESSEAYLKHKKERSKARLKARGQEIASAGGDPGAGVGGPQQSRDPGVARVMAKDIRGVTNPRRGSRPRGTGGNWPPVRAVTSSGRVMPRLKPPQRSSTNYKELLGPAVKNIIEANKSGGSSKNTSFEKLTGKKSRAKVYDSITDALKKGYYGQIFSTKNADRMYVITRRKWGTDKEQAVGGKVAKGFSPGTIPSTFKDIKGYAVRTMVRHGKQKSRKFQGKPYWKGKKK